MKAHVLSIILVGLAASVSAQETPLHKKVSVDYHDQEVAEVLKDLGDRAGVRIVCPPELTKDADRVTLATTRQEIGRVARRILRSRGLALGKLDGLQAAVGRLDALDEIKSKRADRFEFAEKPMAVQTGDRMTIRFAVADFCDATVAIEDADGRILRHLAAGVLGENAPEPFSWNTRRQEIVWDCKDDRGEYVREKELRVRVSLGLKASLERTLYWSPYKLGFNGEQPSFCPAPEGVYVYGAGVGRANLTPWLRLFDHDGRYVRTLYPFPASQLDAVRGLTWASFPSDGPDRKFAVKNPHESQTSLLPWPAAPGEILRLNDVRALLLADRDYVYVMSDRVRRIAKAGSGKPSTLEGPEMFVVVSQGNRSFRYYPTTATISPDGKWFYLTGYSAFYGKDEGHGWLHFFPCVMRMPADCSKPPEPFIGSAEPDKQTAGLACPSGVACDKDGRIYVADITEGLLVFSPDGKPLHQMKMDSPGAVQVAPDTGDIWVAGWTLDGAYGGPHTGQTAQSKNNVILYWLTPFKADSPPKVTSSAVISPDGRANKVYPFTVVMDFFGKARRMWFAHGTIGWGLMGSGAMWPVMNARVFDVKDGKLDEFLSFETQANGLRPRRPGLFQDRFSRDALRPAELA